MKNRVLYVLIFLSFVLLTGCVNEKEEPNVEFLQEEEFSKSVIIDVKGNEIVVDYQVITMREAMEIFEKKGDYLILDVREKEEFDSGHIPGAICIPHEQITEQALNMIPDKNTVIYVYCRSGRRSKIAAQALADAGYVNVTEIGGILDYTGELEMN